MSYKNPHDYRPIIQALEQQKWVLEATSQNHVMACPPDISKQLVCFATSSRDPRAVKNTLRDLKKSGFVWPWPKPANNKQKEEVTVAVPVHAPKEMTTPATEEAEKSVDQLFFDLKEARTYAALARDALKDAQKVMEEAKAALSGSEEESDRAVEQMNMCKRFFDKAFNSEEL